MNTVSSAAALISAIVAGLALLFVWAGTEQVHFDWVAMDDDFSLVQLAEARTPAIDPTYSDTTATAGTPMVPGENYLLWLNVSGFRSDYVENASAPFFKSLADQGNTTDSLAPSFPSLRYPSLITQATGTTIANHGVPANSLRDPESGEVVRFPTKLSLLKAEPIWTTAKRQGMGVLVHDWPFSQEQPAEHGADIFLAAFDPAKSDEERLKTLLDAWSAHTGESKIRLAMASLHDLEKAAREYGSREADTYAAVAKLDGILKTFFDQLKSKWPELRKSEGDKLHVFITTDHGMTDSAKVINFKELMGDLADKVTYAVDDAVANLWFTPPPEGSNQKLFEEKYDEELKARIYWRSYPRGEYPSTFGFGEGGEFFGDRFLVLKGGYSFTENTGSEPVFDPSESGGPFAVSGYSVTDSARMKGQGFFFQLDGGGYGSDVGDVDSTQLHATVCRVLGIQPATGASTEAVDVE